MHYSDIQRLWREQQFALRHIFVDFNPNISLYPAGATVRLADKCLMSSYLHSCLTACKDVLIPGNVWTRLGLQQRIVTGVPREVSRVSSVWSDWSDKTFHPHDPLCKPLCWNVKSSSRCFFRLRNGVWGKYHQRSGEAVEGRQWRWLADPFHWSH